VNPKLDVECDKAWIDHYISLAKPPSISYAKKGESSESAMEFEL